MPENLTLKPGKTYAVIAENLALLVGADIPASEACARVLQHAGLSAFPPPPNPPSSPDALTLEQQARIAAAVRRHIQAGALQIPAPVPDAPDY